MDYEKEYKEICQQLIAAYNTTSFIEVRKAIEKIHPELKENEDERIRKWLYDYISNCPNNNFAFYGGVGKDAVLNYIEKQKEQKPVEWSDSVAKEMFIKALERAVEQTKKDYELTDCDRHSWWEDFKAYSGINPAVWSEEDKHRLEQAIDALGRNGYYVLVDWLKSLPERFNPQPKQEWSKEDENFIKELCNLLASIAKNNYVGRCYAPDLVSKLQSLRPQPQWKPSQEQMKEYSYWYRNFVKSGLASPTSKAVSVLGELLEQLKLL